MHSLSCRDSQVTGGNRDVEQAIRTALLSFGDVSVDMRVLRSSKTVTTSDRPNAQYVLLCMSVVLQLDHNSHSKLLQ